MLEDMGLPTIHAFRILDAKRMRAKITCYCRLVRGRVRIRQ